MGWKGDYESAALTNWAEGPKHLLIIISDFLTQRYRDSDSWVMPVFEQFKLNELVIKAKKKFNLIFAAKLWTPNKKLQFPDVRRTTVNKVSEFFFTTSLSRLNFFKTFPTLDYFYHVLKKSGYRLGTRDCSSNHNLHIIYYSRPASTSLHPPRGCVQAFVCHRYTKWTVRPVIGSPIIQTQNHLVSNKKYETASTKVHFVILIHSGWAFLENATRNSFLIMCLLLFSQSICCS